MFVVSDGFFYLLVHEKDNLKVNLYASHGRLIVFSQGRKYWPVGWKFHGQNLYSGFAKHGHRKFAKPHDFKMGSTLYLQSYLFT